MPKGKISVWGRGKFIKLWSTTHSLFRISKMTPEPEDWLLVQVPPEQTGGTNSHAHPKRRESLYGCSALSCTFHDTSCAFKKKRKLAWYFLKMKVWLKEGIFCSNVHISSLTSCLGENSLIKSPNKEIWKRVSLLTWPDYLPLLHMLMLTEIQSEYSPSLCIWPPGQQNSLRCWGLERHMIKLTLLFQRYLTLKWMKNKDLGGP